MAQQYQIGSFSVEVLKRVLTVLSENGRTKKTILAGKTGLNYIVCLRYINFMKALSWVEATTRDGREYVSVTHVGKKVVDVLSACIEGKLVKPLDYGIKPIDVSIELNVNDAPVMEHEKIQIQR